MQTHQCYNGVMKWRRSSFVWFSYVDFSTKIILLTCVYAACCSENVLESGFTTDSNNYSAGFFDLKCVVSLCVDLAMNYLKMVSLWLKKHWKKWKMMRKQNCQVHVLTMFSVHSVCIVRMFLYNGKDFMYWSYEVFLMTWNIVCTILILDNYGIHTWPSSTSI